MHPPNPEWGRQVAVARARMGLTQAELAHRLGIASASVSRWERGITGPTVANALAVQDLLGVEPPEPSNEPDAVETIRDDVAEILVFLRGELIVALRDNNLMLHRLIDLVSRLSPDAGGDVQALSGEQSTRILQELAQLHDEMLRLRSQLDPGAPQPRRGARRSHG